MRTHVALFRGINVGRAKRVAMADLRALFSDLGYQDVQTVLQSGNVVFTADSLAPDAADAVEAALDRRTGVSARVLLKSAAELRAVAAANPLLDIATDPARLLVTFLAEPARCRPHSGNSSGRWRPDAIGGP